MCVSHGHHRMSSSHWKTMALRSSGCGGREGWWGVDFLAEAQGVSWLTVTVWKFRKCYLFGCNVKSVLIAKIGTPSVVVFTWEHFPWKAKWWLMLGIHLQSPQNEKQRVARNSYRNTNTVRNPNNAQDTAVSYSPFNITAWLNISL